MMMVKYMDSHNEEDRHLIEKDSYFIYVPENFDGSAEALVFYPGAGGFNGNDKFYETYIQTNSDKIVIINKRCFDNTDAVLAAFADVEATSNVSVVSVDMFSHSKGDEGVFVSAEKLNNENYHVSNVTVLDTSHLLSTSGITPELAENFARNSTSVTVISQYTRNYNNSDAMNNMINAGVNISHIYCPCNNSIEFNWTIHKQINDQFLRYGIIDVVAGNKEGFDSGLSLVCKYAYYDYETGEWVDNVNVEDFCERYKISSPIEVLDKRFWALKGLEDIDFNTYAQSIGYDGAMSSNTEFVIQEMNEIRNGIRGTNFIGNLSSQQIDSSSPLFDLENNLSIGYYNASGEILEKLALETQAIIGVSISIDKMESELEEYANLMPLSSLEIDNYKDNIVNESK